MLLAEQFTCVAGAVSAPALITDPQALAYTVLKKKKAPLIQSDINPDYVLSAMAHMPVSKTDRIGYHPRRRPTRQDVRPNRFARDAG